MAFKAYQAVFIFLFFSTVQSLCTDIHEYVYFCQSYLLLQLMRVVLKLAWYEMTCMQMYMLCTEILKDLKCRSEAMDAQCPVLYLHCY